MEKLKIKNEKVKKETCPQAEEGSRVSPGSKLCYTAEWQLTSAVENIKAYTHPMCFPSSFRNPKEDNQWRQESQWLLEQTDNPKSLMRHTYVVFLASARLATALGEADALF